MNVFAGIAEWLSAVGNTVTSGQPSLAHVADWQDRDVIWRHANHWATALACPYIGQVPWETTGTSDLFSCESRTVFGFPRSNIPLQTSQKVMEDHSYAFIRRHLIHRMPNSAIGWVRRFVRMPDKDFIQQSIRTHEEAVLGFAFILWGLHVESMVDMRSWWAITSHDRISRDWPWPWQEHQRLFTLDQGGWSLTNTESNWIAIRVHQAELLLAWHGALAMAQQMARSLDVYWGRDVVMDILGTHGRVNWTAARRPDGRVELLVSQPTRFGLDIFRPRPGKENRRDAWCATERLRRRALLAHLSKYVLIRDAAGEWFTSIGQLPSIGLDGRWCSKYRLLVDDKRYGVIAFDRGSARVARTLELPLEVHTNASEPGRAIQDLKMALTFYLKHVKSAKNLAP